MCERELWTAVINQAITDAAAYLDYKEKRRHTLPNNTSYAEASQGWEFLTASHGEWARSRMDICGGTAVDPDMLRERVLAIVEERGSLSSVCVRDVVNGVGEAHRNKHRLMAAE